MVERAIGAGSFNTLVTAVKVAGLVETLSGAGPFTVFAPIDAFAKLPRATLNASLPIRRRRGVDPLRRPGRSWLPMWSVWSWPPSVQGEAISTPSGGKVVLNGNATVTATDIPATIMSST